jgi:predicted metal-dependent phosphoesterase TrpH
MLKADLHIHTADDPVDRIPHTTTDVIDRAAALGYQVLAITLHERQLDLGSLEPYARERGIVLIAGVERTIEGKHVLLINFRHGAEDVTTFADLARLKARERGLVIAPHPFFPAPSCLRRQLERHADLFDAVEYNAMFTSSLNFNDRAAQWARAHGKPLVGNGDVHRLRQLGTTYSLIDAEPDADAICDAIAAGRVLVEPTPLGWGEAAAIMSDLLLWHAVRGRLTTAWRTERGRRVRPMPA